MITANASTLSLELFDAADALGEAVTGVLTIEVFAASSDGGDDVGPEWIKLAPRGRFTARDGRQFEVDPDVLIQRFNADGVAVPIDVDHAIPKKAMFGETAPAVAWIEELAARDDGLYGRVAWLDEGKAILKKRSHRYISPALKTDGAGKAVWLHSAGLVAAPGISMPAVASADTSLKQEPPMLKKIAQALGLAESADEAACLSAISSLTQRVDKDVHDQTVQTLAATTAQLNALKDEVRSKKVADLMDRALREKKILPAQRTHFEALCATDEGLQQVEKLVEATASGLGASGLDNKMLSDQTATLSAEDREVIQMLGITEEDYRKANNLVVA